MSKTFIDLRSDTVTRPSEGMRAAMAAAAVGDDQYGEDPTVNRLQDMVADLLGKEAALLMPSGTMANQVALKLFTRPGDDVIVGKESHAVWHEAGASAANAGVQFTDVGTGGLFTAEDVRRAAKPRSHVIYPATTLVEVENTHNRGGGLVFAPAELDRIGDAAKELGLASYLDGARLFNAAVASAESIKRLARPFDAVSIALSKGLGAPVGTVLAGTRRDMDRAQRFRRMFGGAMRQAGVLAAAGIYALENNVARLTEDHANARLIATRLAACERVEVDPARVPTNIIVFRLRPGAPAARIVVERCKAQGVLLFAFSESVIRAVTHLDVTREQCERAGDVIAAAVAG
ncbi:MAG TPA: GntG family PLP-dependent aldolase [Alphaproteobacteria bacterium]|nr:GntG family PLP-dependent aldolase [Alphaproteobacteria bacterium]